MDKTKIIVVEDNIVYCEFVCNLLAREKFRTVQAFHLSTAKKLLQQAADGDIVAASVNNEVTLKRLVNRPDRIALEAAYTLKDEYGYKELEGALREAYASVGVRLSDHRLRDLITVLKNKRMIVQENGRKYTFKPDFHY